MKNTVPVQAAASSKVRVEPGLHFQIEDFLNDYAHCLDDDQVESWPAFFTEDANYQVTTRENHEAGRPLGIIYCEGRGMMEDRVRALREANIFEAHVYCHTLSRPDVWQAGPETLQARTNFTIHRTMYNGEAELFATGRYLDTIVRTPSGLAFKDRRVVLDSRRIDTLLVVPL